MELGNYDTIARLEQSNWWYEARREMLAGTLAPLAPFARGVDLGCGVGANLRLLDQVCDEVIGIDANPRAIEWCHSRGFHSVRLGDAMALDLPDESVELVTCLDVLEHVDDRAAMAEISRILAVGGYLAVTVPAHPHLWNENDDHSQHLRRYRVEQLRELLGGLQISSMSYWNFATYLPMLLYCAAQRIRKPKKPENNLRRIPTLANRPLRLLLAGENRLRQHISFPTGTSLVALARKVRPSSP